jgi:hypothetical protein
MARRVEGLTLGASWTDYGLLRTQDYSRIRKQHRILLAPSLHAEEVAINRVVYHPSEQFIIAIRGKRSPDQPLALGWHAIELL